METNKELMRAEFEAWALSQRLSLAKVYLRTGRSTAKMTDNYASTVTAFSEKAWQAAISLRSEAVPSAAAVEQVQAWDTYATTRLRSIVDLLGLQSAVPDGDLTGYEFAVLGHVRREIERLKAAAQPAPSQGDAVPDGWQLVPKEPTQEMHNAARDWSVAKYGIGVGIDGSDGCYRAMLAGAPNPPTDATRQSSADAVDAALTIAREALTGIAAFNDSGANSHLKFHGSYAMFDEPSAVRTARAALLRMNAAEAGLQVLTIPTVNLKGTSE